MSEQLTIQAYLRAERIEALKKEMREAFVLNGDYDTAKSAQKQLHDLGYFGDWVPSDPIEKRIWHMQATFAFSDAAQKALAKCRLPWQHDDWRPWFAWCPVILNDGRIAWLRTVRRRWQEAILHGWEYAAP